MVFVEHTVAVLVEPIAAIVERIPRADPAAAQATLVSAFALTAAIELAAMLHTTRDHECVLVAGGILVTGVALAIPVLVGLGRIGNVRAVVAHVSVPVPVIVFLAGIGHGYAVVVVTELRSYEASVGTIAIAVFVVRHVLRANVTHVSDAVRVRVQLRSRLWAVCVRVHWRVGHVRTVVVRVRDSVAVAIEVAGITDAVVVRVRLGRWKRSIRPIRVFRRVGKIRTVVASVRDSVQVPVRIGLIRIRNVRAVVAHVANAVVIRVRL
jgi:hypothetical protein